MPRFRVLLAIALAVVTVGFASVVDAGLGDYRLLTGTIMWPLDVTTDRTVVIQTDDGVTHFVEFAPTEVMPRVRVGDRVSLIGREGFQPTQILFAQFGHREEPVSSPAALPLAVVLAPTADVRLSPDVVAGTVESVSGPSLRVINRHGHRIQVDVAAIDASILQDLRPGDGVVVYAPMRVSGLPVASGIMLAR